MLSDPIFVNRDFIISYAMRHRISCYSTLRYELPLFAIPRTAHLFAKFPILESCDIKDIRTRIGRVKKCGNI